MMADLSIFKKKEEIKIIVLKEELLKINEEESELTTEINQEEDYIRKRLDEVENAN